MNNETSAVVLAIWYSPDLKIDTTKHLIHFRTDSEEHDVPGFFIPSVLN